MRLNEKPGRAAGLHENDDCVNLDDHYQQSPDICQEVSLFNGISPKSTRSGVRLYSVLDGIRDGLNRGKIESLRAIDKQKNKDKYRWAKEKLPSFTASGTFHYRKNENIKNPTGFIVVDIDDIGDTAALRGLLSADRHIWFAFVSPGGDGVKAGLRAEGIQSDADHKKFYYAAERYFKDNYRVVIDDACKDISRLTFESWDPDLFINKDPAFFDIQKWTPPKKKPKQTETSPPPTTGSGKQKYAEKVISSACKAIRDARPADKAMHRTRLTRSVLAGGYAHYVPEMDVMGALESAVDESATTDPGKAKKTVRDGFAWGQQRPITIPDKTPNTTTKTPPPAKHEIDQFYFLATQDQQGAAEIFCRLYRGIFCFDHAAGRWSAWGGHCWIDEEVDEPLRAVDSVQEVFKQVLAKINAETTAVSAEMQGEVDDEALAKMKQKASALNTRHKNVSKTKWKLSQIHFRKQIIEFVAVGADSLGISGKQWDRKPRLLPCHNGVIDLTTGEIRDGKPVEYLKASCPTEYRPDAECPQFIQFLMDVFDHDHEMVAFLRRVIGSALIGENLDHKLFVLHGRGRNGKDTLLETIKYVLGDDLAGGIQAEMLLNQDRTQSSSGPSADIMRLRGLRLAWANETNEGRRFNSSRVKELTGGGALTGRAPYGRKVVSFPQTHTLFLMTNNRPHADASDYALWKRMILIPFEMSFVDEPEKSNERKADKHLLSLLKKEAPGILSWMVKGCLEWQAQGLNPPEKVRESTTEYQKDEDLMARFIDESCVTGEGKAAYASDLYKAYTAWAGDNGIRPMSNVAFGKKMFERFEKVKSSRGYYYEGIGIIADN